MLTYDPRKRISAKRSIKGFFNTKAAGTLFRSFVPSKEFLKTFRLSDEEIEAKLEYFSRVQQQQQLQQQNAQNLQNAQQQYTYSKNKSIQTYTQNSNTSNTSHTELLSQQFGHSMKVDNFFDEAARMGFR